jgi:hypothetical protein
VRRYIYLDGGCDSKYVYVSPQNKFPNAKIVTPSDKNAIIDDKNQHLHEVQEI